MQVKFFFDSIDFSLSPIPDYSWIKAMRQRKLRINLHSATKLVETLLHKGAFWCFTDFKRGKLIFSSPSPPCNVVPLFELPIENNKHPNFEWRGGGGVWILLFSEVTLFEHNVSTILSPVVGVRKFNLHLVLTCNMYVGRCIWSSTCSATSVHVNWLK